MTVDVKRQLALVDPSTGELIPIEVGVITVAEAAARLPLVQRTLRELRRFEQFLADTVAADMRARGATERRVDDLIYELKPEATWIVDDGGALFRALLEALGEKQITDNEFNEAVQQLVTFKFDHRRLNVLARRVPAIDQLRRRVEGDARLRVKSK